MKQILLAAALVLGFSQVASANVNDLFCVGTEPFFALDISVANGMMKETSPEDLKGTMYKIDGPINAQGLQDSVVMVFKGHYSDITLNVISEHVAGKCSDGMSDEEYSYHLVYVNGQNVKYGCCKLM